MSFSSVVKIQKWYKYLIKQIKKKYTKEAIVTKRATIQKRAPIRHMC